MLGFLSESDAKFVKLVSPEAEKTPNSRFEFSLKLNSKGLQSAPEHWIKLVAHEVKQYVCLRSLELISQKRFNIIGCQFPSIHKSHCLSRFRSVGILIT
jgi:hypothetical protein